VRLVLDTNLSRPSPRRFESWLRGVTRVADSPPATVYTDGRLIARIVATAATRCAEQPTEERRGAVPSRALKVGW